jgi:hypothetical protein
MKPLRHVTGVIFVLGLLVVSAPFASAGPPLLCHPLEIGGARSLPFGTNGWQAARDDYDRARLVPDTIALLSPETPVIVRMETLRRATVYAMKDPRLAAALYDRLRARTQGATGQINSAALFDLGYLIETYKQAAPITKTFDAFKSIDGYESVVKAIRECGGQAEMEFAAALISVHPPRPARDEHLRRAVAGARDGSLLARNLVSHFNHRGRTLAELRSGIAKI